MTESVLNSDPIQTKLTAVTTFLNDNGIDFERLMFVSTGSEQVIGEFVEDEGESVTLRNPLRFFRIQRLTQGGSMEVQFMVGSYDMMGTGGTIVLVPQAYFNLPHQPIETRLSYALLLAQYVDARTQNQALSAGLVLPQSVIPPR
jgi:hypothetical protein